MVNILGIAASVFVLFSLLKRGEKRVRSYNIVGAALFVAYGISVGSVSIAALSGAVILIHACRIHEISAQSKYLRMWLGTLYAKDNNHVYAVEEEEK